MGNTVLAQPEDAGMIRVDEETGLGVALATDGNGRFAKLDPYAGAQLALAEAYRNVAVTGAEPLAVTDCLNFGSPEDPDVMWQFAEAVARPGRRLPASSASRSPAATSASTTRPATSRSTRPRWSGVLGVIDDVRKRRTPMGFAADGRRRAAARRRRATSSAGRSGRTYVHGHLGGLPPAVDLAAEKALAALLLAAARASRW